MNYGFVKVASAVPSVKVADCRYNILQIESLIAQAEGKGIEVICFPELSITAYTCGDLFAQQMLLDEAEMALISLLDFTRSMSVIAIVGIPLAYRGLLLNCAAVIQKGKILGLVPKTYLPNYREFAEARWFTSAADLPEVAVRICGQQVPMSNNMIFQLPHFSFAVELCEDLWATIPPSSKAALKGAEIIFNPCADTEVIGKHHYLKEMLAQQSARCLAGYVLSGSGFGESTQDCVFGGKALIYENGTLLAEGERFALKEQLVTTEIDVERLRMERQVNKTFAAGMAEHRQDPVLFIDTELIVPKEFALTRSYDPTPFIPKGELQDESCEEALQIQAMALAKRVVHTHTQHLVLGISGGLDSTLALLICVRTMDLLGMPRKNILGVTMPGFGTTGRTYRNAQTLMQELGISVREISIKEACMQHFQDLGIDAGVHDVTYENSQARERTQILMDVANQVNGLVIGTGDLSELALGWATYNGDHMSMYGVNASIPKTLVRHLVEWIARKEENEVCRNILLDIVDTPISPELVPADTADEIQQKTEDLVGPYELHDFFLYYTLQYGFRPAKIYHLAQQAFKGTFTDEEIKKWLTTFFRRFFAQQFKRSCLPDGPKVTCCSLSPRGDWHMPSDASSASWLEECSALQ